jgi:DNA (cytosine-5)-methyltransferase 1
LENVKNLVGHNNGETFNIIKESLTNLGYFVKYKVLNGMEYGNIPQNRERIYILAFLDKNQYNLFEFPQKIPLTTKLFDVIDFFGDVDEKYYYTEGKYKGNIFDELSKAMEEESIDCPSVYQWRRIYVRKNQSGVVPCICCNSGAGGHNLPLIKDSKGRIRKLTPKECFNVQGYPKDYKYPNLSDARLYKAAGNSVVVPVVARIAHNLKNII